MKPGQLIAERFEVERLAGWGGMAAVYRATDRLTGGPVAVKLLHGQDERDAARFGREAQLLAQLHHPGIVKYVAHGQTGDGQRFLAMEWLEGEDLASRLAGSGLTIDESMALVVQVSEALGVAHARGIVHRDITPGNLFLPNGNIHEAKVLDFGIARLSNTSFGTTRHGVVLGTLWYMSPEQAKGLGQIDARADVFALGCVLFECLVGRPPFMADDLIALLAKILLEETPHVRDLRPQCPEALDALVSRMLAKDPVARPADGAAVAAEVRALGHIGGTERPPQSVRPAALTASEQKLVCVVLAGPALALPRGEHITTASNEVISAAVEKLRDTVSAFGGRLEKLLDGSLLATPSGAGAATDQAAKAARCALAMRALLPEVPIALATGRALMAQTWPVGEVIDRAARLLRSATNPSQPAARRHLPIRLDEATAGLLSSRFDVRGDASGLVLVGEREQAEAARTLLGRLSPCVGRERELGALLALYDECIAEPVARPVLVTGPAGVGKSRLRHEFIHAIEQRDSQYTLFVGRGDPMRAGSPFGILAPALRAESGLLDGEPLPSRRMKLRTRVARHVATVDVQRVTEFLGEMLGVPFPDEDSVQLRAARQDAVLMGDQMRRAWEDFLASECANHPVIIVLEDLHWGDLPSVKFIDSALRTLVDQPLIVLAMARAEVHELFPQLWSERGIQPLPLGELSRKASEKLVRHMLGDRVDTRTVKQIVERAAGNAFYLEELIRAVSEGKGDRMPDTVLAMVQERLERLDPESRRLLRAASVFGQVFWRGGVLSLLGGPKQTVQTDVFLQDLCDRELVSRRKDARFPGEQEFVFRHALVRDAAYATLTEQDRVLGHKLAGAFLEKAGESDAVLLAEHLERGGDLARAVVWYCRAVEQAVEGNDFAAAIARADRAVAGGATGELLGSVRLLQAGAHKWRGEYAKAESCALVAMEELPRASDAWYAAAGELAMATGRLGNYERLCDLAATLTKLGLSANASSPQVIAWVRATVHLLHAGRYELGEELLRAIVGDASAVAARDPLVAARVHQATGHRALIAGDPAAFIELVQQAARQFAEAGDLRSACLQQSSYGYGCIEVGSYREAQIALQDALASAERMGLSNVIAEAKHNLGLALARLGALGEAITVETDAMEAFKSRGDRRMEGGSRVYLALIFVLAGELDRAEREALEAAEILTTTPPIRAFAMATLAQVHLAKGESLRALSFATKAMQLVQSLGGIETGEALVRLAHAEALAMTGNMDDARSAIRSARDLLLARAAKISNAEVRAGFLEHVPENARTLSLASTWVGATHTGEIE